MAGGETRGRRIAVIVALAAGALALVLAAATLGVLWHLARHAGAPDHAVPFLEPPDRPAPSHGVPLFRTARVGERYEVVDDAGRVVLLRGVEMGSGSLRPPYRPIALGDERPFWQLRSWGFNAVRLAVPWEALEPTPRTLNLDHVRYVQWVLEAAHRNGLVVIVDNPLHGVSRCLGGAGAPVWAHRPGLASEEAVASDCADPGERWLPDWPRRLRWWADFYDGAWTPDDRSLQDHLIHVFVKLAEVLQNDPALLGYGLVSGAPCDHDGLAARLYPGATACEAALSDFHRRFARALRAVDADALLFFEEPTRWHGEGPSGVGVEAPPVDGVVWSVPAQSVVGEGPWRRADCRLLPDLQALLRRATVQYHAPLVLSGVEAPGTGARARDAALHRMVDLEDAGISVSFRDYSRRNGWCDARDLVVPEGCPGSRAEPGTPRCATGVLVRPYPIRIGGVPVAWDLDRSFGASGTVADTRHDGRPVENRDVFTLVFRQGSGYADTWVFVPRRPVYGEDPATEAPEFTVAVSDGRWRWAEWDDQVLVWTPDPAVAEHRLVVKPWGGRPAPGNGVGECVEDAIPP